VTLVVDASVVVAALVDTEAHGKWAEGLLVSDRLAAPHLLLVETANVLRRAVAAGEVSDDIATLADADLLDLSIDLFDYEPFAARVWELRGNLNAYDAWYVAVAEALEAPLATLDRRVAGAPGIRCRLMSPAS
jgi:predicted nucleic acid-binding protein